MFFSFFMRHLYFSSFASSKLLNIYLSYISAKKKIYKCNNFSVKQKRFQIERYIFKIKEVF